MAYFTACSVSCGLALGLKSLVNRVSFRSNFTRALGEIAIPFTAVSSAGFANVVVMRYNETVEGVNIMDNEGNIYGKSKKAGVLGVLMSGMTRVCMPISYLILTPGIIRILEHIKYYPQARLPKELMNILFVSISL